MLNSCNVLDNLLHLKQIVEWWCVRYNNDKPKSKIESAKIYIKQEKYEKAISELEGIEIEDSLYSEAQQLLQVTDSLIKMSEEEKKLAIETEAKRKAEDSTVTTSKENNSLIPGIEAIDVYGNLEDRGFTVSKSISSNGILITCEDESSSRAYIAQIFGTNYDEIFAVKATVLNYSNQNINTIAKPFLGYIASLPYNNSKPIKARDWVYNNIYNSGSITIEGVKFEINANGGRGNRILTITSSN